MSRQGAPYGRRLMPEPLSAAVLSDWRRRADPFHFPDELVTFLLDPPPVPWWIESGPPHTYGGSDVPLVWLGVRESGWTASARLSRDASETALVVGYGEAEAPGLLYPSVRSALYMWVETLRAGFDLFELADFRAWDLFAAAWYTPFVMFGLDGYPADFWPSLARRRRHVLDLEVAEGCLRGVDDLERLLDEADRCQLLPSDWIAARRSTP